MTNPHSSLVAIASGKGGTGKTFLATNLAAALAREGERVLLFDGDLGLSNVSVQLGMTESTRFAAVLAGLIAAQDAAQPFLGGAGKRGGFDVLAGLPGSGDLADVPPAMILRTVAALRLSLGYDRVLIDLGAGVDESVLRFAAAADRTLVVLTPDPSAITDAYAFVKMLAKRTKGRDCAFLVNQAENAADARHTAETLLNACKTFLGLIPENLGFIRRDPKAYEAVRRQDLLMSVDAKSPAAEDIRALAQSLIHHSDQTAPAPRRAAR